MHHGNQITGQTLDLQINSSGETIRLGPIWVRFLISGEDSRGSIAVFEGAVPAGQRLAAPAHSHNHYEETIYVIDGVLTFTIDGKQSEVEAGQALWIPRGAVHRFDNNGSEDAKGLCVITPAAIGPQYFREAAEGDQRGGRRAAGPGKDGGDYDPSRPHASSASGSIAGEETCGVFSWRKYLCHRADVHRRTFPTARRSPSTSSKEN